MVNEYLKAAYELAERGMSLDEVPIGAVIVRQGVIIGRGHNTRQTANDVTGHAEINALRQANQALKSWRLVDCDLYSTIEPCLMCTGALLQARIKSVYFGKTDPKAGACGGLHSLHENNQLNHSFTAKNLNNEACANIIKQFFASRRS